LLQGKIDGLKVSRAAKEDAMKKQNRERALLEDERKEKDAVVSRLQSQEKELKKQMAAKQKQDARLASAINAAIKRARDLAIKEAAKRSADEKAAAARVAASEKANATKARPDNSDEALAPATLNTVKAPAKSVFSSEADMHLTGDFENNQHRLPWPVSGTISMSFGRHEYIKGIWHDNAGITIDVQSGAAVKSVFKGEVQSVFNVGDVQAVMIRHGKYFTTYSNLSTVSVSKGEQVVTGQIIGRVGDVGQLEFVLSNERTNLDPERWLKR
jgi:septal ring factor EnvC (AmiA/AmiB activator)